MIWILLGLIAVPVLVWGFINLTGTLNQRALHLLSDEHTPPDAAAPPPGDEPIAILCPARNEEAHLRQTLTDLCEQDHPDYRVILIDDASDDATGRIADELATQYPHLHVLHTTKPPPAGWVGKNWAIHQGYQYLQQLEAAEQSWMPATESNEQRSTTADSTTSQFPTAERRTLNSERPAWLCFTDADVRWSPDLLRLSVAHAHAHEADMTSLLPGLEFGSFSEAIVQLQMMLALQVLMPMDKAMDPEDRRSIAAGAFILIERGWYDHIGGHEAVANKVVEDINLSRVLKAQGATLRVAWAKDHLWCRMYDGFAAQWEGLTKNAFAGLDYSWWRAAGVIGGALIANVLPPIYLLIALVWFIAVPSWLSGTALVSGVLATILSMRALYQVRKVTDLPRWYGLTMPVGSGLYLAILIASMWRSVRGGNRWKGRAYRPNAGA